MAFGNLVLENGKRPCGIIRAESTTTQLVVTAAGGLNLGG